MKNIAVIICNYNKKEYVKKCIESLSKQDTHDFDIYVVDNASTDGSADEIRALYGKTVTLICNNENLGGSGGFNTGMKQAYEAGYEYIVLLDNDVVLDEKCISTFYRDMESNPGIGIMGAKILKMDKPDVIQEYGSFVDFKEMRFLLAYENEKEPDVLPKYNECDYVPACALVVRKETINRIGFMPKENFIYYDDILWGMRCKRAGFRVVANRDAVAWHKGGGGLNPSTFPNYYLIRNKTRFFSLNADAVSVNSIDNVNEILAKNILREVFEGVYACAYNGLHNIAKTRFDAFLDALNGITGKAPEGRIREKEKSRDRLYKLIENRESILINMCGDEADTRRIISEIRHYEITNNKSFQIEVASDKAGSVLGIPVIQESTVDESAYDLVINACRHIFYVDPDQMDRTWVDGWTNVIADKKDAEQCKGFESSFRVFELCFSDRLISFIDGMNTAEMKEFGCMR